MRGAVDRVVGVVVVRCRARGPPGRDNAPTCPRGLEELHVSVRVCPAVGLGWIGDAGVAVRAVECRADNRRTNVTGYGVDATVPMARLGESDCREHFPRESWTRARRADIRAQQIRRNLGSGLSRWLI